MWRVTFHLFHPPMLYTDHRKARHHYEILETFEGGLVLTGQEVKAVREGGAKLDGAYIRLIGGQVTLVGARIAPYSKSGTLEGYDPEHPRRVLVTAKERRYLATKTQIRGLTIVPLSFYPNARRIKVSFAIARGKQLHDKRESLKKRDLERDQRRET